MPKTIKKNKNGFTLIETIIYIALLGFIMGGTLTVVYQLLESGGSLNHKTVVQNEANFVLRKFNWAFSGASDFSIPSSDFIKITRYDGVEVDFCLDGTVPSAKVIKIRRGRIGSFACVDATFVPISTQNILVNSFVFAQIGSNPKGVTLSLDINGKNFTATKYLRK